MSASAGRVLLIPKGAYNASATYAPLDYVTYTDGNTYVCKAATTGHAPTDTTYWQILVDNSGVVHTVDIANDLTTQTAGKVLDARQGYALNTSLTQQMESIAPIENGATVAKSGGYSIGDQFYRNGVLYIATAPIGAGLNWSNLSGSYVEARKITAQINSAVKLLNEYVNGLHFVKRGYNVQCYGLLENLSTAAALINFGSVPIDFRPMTTYAIGRFIQNVSPYIDIGSLWIADNGSITLYKPQSASVGFVYISYTAIA